MKNVDLTPVDEILRRSVLEPESKLADEFGFTHTQFLSWQAKYGKRVKGKVMAQAGGKFVDNKSYYVTLMLSKKESDELRHRSTTLNVRGKDGKMWSLSVD